MKRATFSRLLPGVALFATILLLTPVSAADLSGEEVYKKALKSTVWILVKDGEKVITGSGALIDAKQRLVLTNYHVVMAMGMKDSCLVQFPIFDKKNNLITETKSYFELINTKGALQATVVCVDNNKDLAILRLTSPNLPKGVEAVRLGENSPGPGAEVHSVGSPGLSDALFGYCPGKVRNSYVKKWSANAGGGKVLNFEAKIIETNSGTSFGDSGGPLFNARGEQVGVTQGGSGKDGNFSYFIDVSEIRSVLKTNKLTLTPQGQGVAMETKKEPTEPTIAETTSDIKTEPKIDPKKVEPKKESNAVADERTAETKLSLIKTLMDQGKKEIAAQRLADLIKAYPSTEAAKEAKELLKKLK